jgi:hypothetical protein
MKKPDDIQIDWDVIVYQYDPATGQITVANWQAGQPPLPIARVFPRLSCIQELVHGLVNKANEKLAADLLARDLAEFSTEERKKR